MQLCLFSRFACFHMFKTYGCFFIYVPVSPLRLFVPLYPALAILLISNIYFLEAEEHLKLRLCKYCIKSLSAYFSLPFLVIFPRAENRFDLLPRLLVSTKKKTSGLFS